ncbi:signal transduction histidine kinase [Pseudomonas sp. BIGb0408]|uniref:histidine kinase n=1 Tax=Phytopseudomonas flavescens TaxID=29435 RepID=A0A7Y9XP93_9GAMM|nr:MULTISPECIES: hybrid sensor histidine kinase/response regulator [Pseudomonas]MCW2290394.1 signal transduction histidine kinase [Pseudomonas sp. BIGb0408]NYH75033.1 signal transduction histidine kinase [Pseudomonas flavescens]
MPSESCLFAGQSGDTVDIIRRFDWAATSLGPINQWPDVLVSSTRLILSSPTPIVLLCGPSGVLIYNDAYATFAGLRHPEIFGVPAEEAWPEIADWNRHVIATGLAGKSISQENLYLPLRRPGLQDDAWMNLYFNPLLDAQGNSHGMMCIAVETTQQMVATQQRAQAEAELREANERIELALNAGAVLGTWVWDVPNDSVSGDERFARVFSIDPQEARQGMKLERVTPAIHPDDRSRVEALIARTMQTGGDYRAEYRLLQPDGSYRWTEANGHCELAADGTPLRFPGVLIDIEKHKQTELALRQLTQNLEERVSEAVLQRTQAEELLRQAQKMEAIGQLTGGIAHDFNNLLAGILGSLELIQRKLPAAENPVLMRFVEAAIASANRGASLTHRLLAFARRQSLDMRPVEVNALVQAIKELLTRTLGEQIKLEIQLAEDLWPTRSDGHQLENALINLAINARDAMPDGGTLRVETRNTQLSEADAKNHQVPAGDYLLLAVSDTGCGMSQEIIRHAFEPFFTTKPIGQGTGLGLSMVYGFVKQTGGYLQLESQVDRGTTLNLYLPRLHVAPTEPTHTAPLPAPRGTGERILVVEDDKVVRMLIVEVLEELGYQLIQAGDAQSALSLLEQHWPLDLLLTDVGLPGMNGRQLADAARYRQPNLKVLFATGYAEGAEVRDGYLSSGMEMIAKPFSFEALASKIKTMLEG